MRLMELEPRWVAEFGAPLDCKQGVSFLCPHCRQSRLAIFFDVPISAHPPADIKRVRRLQAEKGHLCDQHVGRTLWHRDGDTFHTLTLNPSVDASHFGHWHGFITNGAIR